MVIKLWENFTGLTYLQWHSDASKEKREELYINKVIVRILTPGFLALMHSPDCGGLSEKCPP